MRERPYSRTTTEDNGKPARSLGSEIPAQSETRRFFKLGAERWAVEGENAPGFRRAFAPNEARAVARERDKRQRPGAPVEFDADIFVRTLMRKGRGDGDLIIGPSDRADAGSFPGRRSAAVGRYDERRAKLRTILEGDTGLVAIVFKALEVAGR